MADILHDFRMERVSGARFADNPQGRPPTLAGLE
jgi:hypothetical protein